MKLNLIILLVITLAANNKLISSQELNEEQIIKTEVLQPQLIPLSSKINLKETSLRQDVTENNNALKLGSIDEANKFQKAQAKLMSYKRKTLNAEDEKSKTNIEKNLKNALRINRIEMVKNEHPELPRMLSYYLDKKNRDEMRRLSKAKLLPDGFDSYNKRLVEVPAFLKTKHNNHQRILDNIDSSSNANQKSSKKNVHTLSASKSKSDDRYFLSSAFLENRMNNTLRKHRHAMLKKEDDSNEMPVILAHYLKRKANNERNQLAAKGIILDDYESSETSQSVERKHPHIKANRNGKLKEQLIKNILEKPVHNEDLEEDYELTTTRRTPKKPNILVVYDENQNSNAQKKVNANKNKVKPQPASVSYDEEEAVVVQQPKNNKKSPKHAVNNQHSVNKVNNNRPQRKQKQVQVDEDSDEEVASVKVFKNNDQQNKYNNNNNNNQHTRGNKQNFNNQNRRQNLNRPLRPVNQDEVEETNEVLEVKPVNANIRQNNKNNQKAFKKEQDRVNSQPNNQVVQNQDTPVEVPVLPAPINRKYRNKSFRRKQTEEETDVSTTASNTEDTTSADELTETTTELQVAETTTQTVSETTSSQSNQVESTSDASAQETSFEETTTTTAAVEASNNQEEQTSSVDTTTAASQIETTTLESETSTSAQSVNLQVRQRRPNLQQHNPRQQHQLNRSNSNNMRRRVPQQNLSHNLRNNLGQRNRFY